MARHKGRKGPMLRGRELSPEELDMIRVQLESHDTIEHVDDEMRALIEEQWPHLAAKLRRARPR